MPSYFDNRELSWLKFNERVLEESMDESVPLFERLRFVSIYCSNLDEFFMIRVGSLHDQILVNEEKPDNKTNLTSSEQLSLIAKKVSKQIPIRDKSYQDIMSKLMLCGVEQVSMSNISDNDYIFLREYFKSEIQPLLSPSIIDKKHPIPFLKNKEIYISALLKHKSSDKKSPLVGILPAMATGVFPRIIYLPSTTGIRFVLVEELICFFADLVFSNYEIINREIFRITRNADIDVDEALYDHDVDFRNVMEQLIKKRKKLAPVRIEYLCEKILDEAIVVEKLQLILGTESIFRVYSPLDMSFVFQLEEKLKDKPELFFKPLIPQKSFMMSYDESILKQLDKKDILLSYPFESFKPFISFLEEAANDKDVISIKITLYRVARDSKIVNALIKAAENGKDVLAMVELRARFDEENNIGWSKQLEEAGVQVIYGIDDLKVHSKLLLITKKVGSSIKYYTQVGTGNYNERTAKLYTDFTLMTSNPDFGSDASMVFNSLSVGTTVESSTTLLVAPNCMKSRIVNMIDTELAFGKDGYIGLKLNSLTDKDIIEKLVEANQHGVKIELVVRGICCLIAGIPGVTENITVISIVGRFLEHSRIYIFGKGERRKVYISSADFMTRNTERRVEVAAPVKNSEIAERIVSAFNLMLCDNVKARVQTETGDYFKRCKASDEQELDTQQYFFKQAYKRAESLNTETSRVKKGFLNKIFTKDK